MRTNPLMELVESNLGLSVLEQKARLRDYLSQKFCTAMLTGNSDVVEALKILWKDITGEEL